MKLNKERLSSAKVLEPVAFTQQSGSHEAERVCWHITAERPELWLMSNKIDVHKVFLSRFKKQEINIIMINNLHFNQLLRQRFKLHFCFGLFMKWASAAMMVSQKPLADCRHRQTQSWWLAVMPVVALFLVIVTTRSHQLACFKVRFGVTPTERFPVCVFNTSRSILTFSSFLSTACWPLTTVTPLNDSN